MKYVLLIVVSILLLSGCDRTTKSVNRLKGYDYTSNVRAVAGNYVMYDIERGTVTCREHSQRAELSCWNKIRL